MKISIVKVRSFLKNHYCLAKLVTSIGYKFFYSKKKSQFDKALTNFQADKLYKKIDKNKLIKDIVFCNLYYGVLPEEYFRYQFPSLSDLERREYIPLHESAEIFNKFKNAEMHELFKNKYKAYLRFKDYYKRHVMLVDSNTSVEEFADFCNKTRNFIVKPIKEQGGEGIWINSLNDNYDVQKELNNILSKGDCVVEELIEQAEGLKKFHPSSVNTIRIITFLKGDDFDVLESSIRIGIGNSVVDNGCLSAAVDYEKGVIITRGRNAHSTGLYVWQPDTNEQILGASVPCWDELKSFLKEVVKVVPEQRLIGWDFALSNKGWVIVEVNTSPAIQILAGEGLGMRQVCESLLQYCK